MDFKEAGILLKEARLKRRFKVKTIADALKIRSDYIEAIEEGNIAPIEGKIYPWGYIKSYAGWIGLDGDAIVKSIKASLGKAETLEQGAVKDGNVLYQEKPRFLRYTVVMVCAAWVMAMAGYVVWQKAHQALGASSKMTEAASTVGEGKYVWEPASYKVVTGDLPLRKAALPIKLKSEGGMMVLMAKDDNVVRIKEGKKESKTYVWHRGDTYFIPAYTDIAILADDPRQIEVFTEGEGEVYLGLLSVFAGKVVSSIQSNVN